MDQFIITTSALASLSTYHQVFRLFKNKSSNDISFIHVSSVLFNMLSHLIYSIMHQNQTLTITFGNGLAATAILLLISCYYYKRNETHVLLDKTEIEIENK